jgi:cytochrome c553
MRAVTLIFCLIAAAVPACAQDDAGAQFFESKIRPLLAENCYGCHSHNARKLKASLYLDSREGALKGGESGPALVPGSPQESRLIESVGYKNVDLQMPPKDKLSDRQIADLTAWVKMGAPWGVAATASSSPKPVDEFNLAARKAKHWAWQPVRPQTPPAVKDATWPTDGLDHFILARLEQANLKPAAPADKRTLIRRATFVVTGLPPSPAEVDAFLADASPDAFSTVVDRLLASPAFGERWGRHWLDLVRYAETMGHEFDFPIPNAWRYRDYVIRALNADLPYDRFLTEQVAGDLLPDPRRNADGTNESILGTGFYFFGEDVQAPVDVRQHQADLFDNRIDVLGKSMLGLTIACARCHDHKFDAISAADYYALYGYLKATRYTQTAVNQRDIAAKVAELKRVKAAIRRAVARVALANLPAAPIVESIAAPATPPRSGDIDLTPESWLAEGLAFTRAVPGEFVVGDERQPVRAFATPARWHSGLVSARLEGALRSPTLTLSKRYLHVRAAGVDSRLNVIVDNFNVIREPIYGGLKRPLKSAKPTWLTIDLKMWQGRQAYIELIDNSVPDPGGPAASAGGWASIERALLSDDAAPPPTPVVATQSVTADADALRAALESWADGSLAKAGDTDARVVALGRVLAAVAPSLRTDEIGGLIREYRRIESSLPAPVYALAATDGPADDEHLFIRGSPKNLGPKIPRRFLEALTPGGPSGVASSSPSRLDLARRIADPANPLTSRVIVNRVWHHLFGRGIVASVDNFGALGDAPSHPELLDYLAGRFVQDGWSLKRLIRTILLSRTWQQSSHGGGAADAADPDNKLLHRQNVHRLEAEAIRDALLAISGRLDRKMYGPSVPVHLTEFMEGRGRPGTSGPLDGAGRRSIYLEVRRNFLPPMLLAFDTPTPFNTMGRRSVSNVPAQALILMNDPFVQQQAQLWARAIGTPESDEAARLTRMYLQAFARPPTESESRTLLAFLKQTDSDPQAWTDLAHALINTKEFIFLN